MQNTGANQDQSDTNKPSSDKELRNLARFLAAWCDAVGIHPSDLAERAEQVKQRWLDENLLTPSEIKRFGSSRPHFYRLLKGQIPIEYNDRDMLQYLSEIFEIAVVQDPVASGARYLFPLEQLASCPMHHLYLELDPGGTSGMHRHFSGTEMMRLDEGGTVAVKFPTRTTNQQQVTLKQGEVVFFDATLPHQVVNESGRSARLFISRNYDFDVASPGTHDMADINQEM